MNLYSLLIGSLLFIIAHVIVFYQLNGQFLWNWFKENELLMGLIGVPVALLMIWGTKYTVEGFDGLLWPQRLVVFALGMVSFAFCTYWFLGESLTTKTYVSLSLAMALVLIQVFWK